MTIAAIYVSPEGVVLGADSTSSYQDPTNGFHYFDFGQKIFEVGSGGTLGLMTWGLGGLGPVSYRALVAELGDALVNAPVASVAQAAERWIELFWSRFSAMPEFARAEVLKAKGQHDPNDSMTRTQDEEDEWFNLRSLSVGFCLAGRAPGSRDAQAQVMVFQVGEPRPVPQAARQFELLCWGMPNIFNRLLYGVEQYSIDAVLATNKWTGTEQELAQALVVNPLAPSVHLPIRDAIDYVHSVIYCTIKGMKFSRLPQVCGGPIEIAVITVDRDFRWVRHKALDAAIADGEPT